MCVAVQLWRQISECPRDYLGRLKVAKTLVELGLSVQAWEEIVEARSVQALIEPFAHQSMKNWEVNRSMLVTIGGGDSILSEAKLVDEL
jgi:predicted regulator of amino acid metabolism with ACT domain